MTGILYCIAIGVFIGVVWSARNHDTTGGFAGFFYKIVEVGVWGSLAVGSGYTAYSFWFEDMYSVVVLFGLMSVMFAASPLNVIYELLPRYPHPATKSMYGSARINN